MIRVAIRFDDASPVSRHDIEQGIIAALEDNDVRATFAVVPFSKGLSGRVKLDASNGAHLLIAHQRGLIEVALHGHSHLRRSSGTLPSEFLGIPNEHQTSMVTEGVTHLRSLFGAHSVCGFVPPWNSFDGATLAALECNRFTYLSGSVHGHNVTSSGPLNLVPLTCQFTDIEPALIEARKYAALSPHIVAVLHPHDFRESGDGGKLDQFTFRQLLHWVNQQPDIQVMTLRDLITANGDDGLTSPYKRCLRAEHLPWRLRQRLPKRCTVNASLWRTLIA